MWKCQTCETMNDGEYCVVCGSPRIQAASGQNASGQMTGTIPRQAQNQYGNGNMNRVYSPGQSERMNNTGKEIENERNIEKAKKQRFMFSVGIGVMAFLILLEMVIFRWRYPNVEGAVGFMDVIMGNDGGGILTLSNIERVCTIVMIILCFVPAAMSFIPLEARYRNTPFIVSLFSFILVTIYCVVIICDTIFTHPTLKCGVFVWLAPLELLATVIFIRMKIKWTNKIDNLVFKPVMYGLDMEFNSGRR